MSPLAHALYEYVSRVYADWRSYGAGRREPSISVGWLKAHLDDVGVRAGDQYVYASDRQRYRMIQQALSELVRAELLVPTRGLGMRGREVLVYEPRRDPRRRRVA